MSRTFAEVDLLQSHYSANGLLTVHQQCHRSTDSPRMAVQFPTLDLPDTNY